MSNEPISVAAEFDAMQLAEVKYRVGTDALYKTALKNLQKDAILVGDAAAKRATPVVQGHARRSTAADMSRMEVVGRYPYLDWLDIGKDSRGREIRNPRGGYKIREFAVDAVKDAIPALLDRAGREIAGRWSA